MSFITEDVINKIVRTSEPNRVVTESKWEVLKKKSKGFCSDTLQICVLYKLLDGGDRVHEQRYFVKDPYNSAMYPRLKDTGMYEKEVYMYETVLPELHRLLGEECLAPKLYCTDTKHALILQDLSLDDYGICDRHKQFDFEHCVESLKHLAKLHAASVRLNEVSPDILNYAKAEAAIHLKAFQNSEGREFFRDQLKAVLKSVYAEQMKSREGVFRVYEDRFIDKLIRIMNDEENPFKVLVHADLWVNNIMFKYDKNKNIEGVKLVDFQLCHWAAPVIDLYHLFITSVRFSTFEEHFDVLLEVYVSTMNRLLGCLGSSTSLSLDELRKSFDRMQDYGFYVVSYLLTLAMMGDEAMQSHNMNAQQHIQNESYRTLAVKWLSYFDKKGVFERE